VAADLHQVWSDRDMPARARRLARSGRVGLAELADALLRYWAVVLAPHWERMRAVREEDVALRASSALTGGLFELLGDLHRSVRLEDSMLTVAMPYHAAADYAGAQLTLVPSIFCGQG